MNYKGFDKDLKCRSYQYEIGGEYEAEGEIVACRNGFHACEDPLDVFRYYPPATSRYCVVEQFGDLRKDCADTKVASRKIKIGAEIGLPGLIKAKIEYVKSHTTTEHTDPGKATAGDHGAATAGDHGVATARGSVSVGENGCGLVRGEGVKARGDLGAILVICVESNNDYSIKEWKAVVVDGETVKANTWYTLEDGELKEVKE